MGLALIPTVTVTAIWGVVAIVLPLFVPKGPNAGVTRCSLILTGVLCWLFWACCYLCQMNPLIGPRIDTVKLALIAKEWGNGVAGS